jgi:hypothetical protein
MATLRVPEKWQLTMWLAAPHWQPDLTDTISKSPSRYKSASSANFSKPHTLAHTMHFFLA